MASVRGRWTALTSGDLQARVGVWLVAGANGDPPEGVERHEGRWDLRGFSLPEPAVLGEEPAAGSTYQVISGVPRLTGVQWASLDLSQSRLPNMRLFDSTVADCLFDGADCRDWRMWNSGVTQSSFEGANLRDGALGTWHEGRANTWRDVSFDGADARGALFMGGRLIDCTFNRTRLSGAEFLQTALHGCVFSGPLHKVLFDGREVPGRPRPEPLRDCDFSAAAFDEVEFRGCRFTGGTMPADPDVHLVHYYPAVAQRALELASAGSGVEARMLAAELTNALRLPGSDDSVSVFNRRDYLASGGESLADFAEAILMEAANDVGSLGGDTPGTTRPDEG